ncbi:hypothetical protein HN51_036590 [Arachis hypogaea]
MGYSVETFYDVDCIHRILDHFMSIYLLVTTSPLILEEGTLIAADDPLTSMTMALAVAIPDYSRPLDDGIYHAVDIYLKAHPWLIDTEREQLCRLMNCQKLSIEASTHVVQNERLPLRVIVQVLFFEQLRLRTSISG